MNLDRAVKCSVIAACMAVAGQAAVAAPRAHSWGGRAAAAGGTLVEATVMDTGHLRVTRSLCSGHSAIVGRDAVWPVGGAMPAPGSRVVGLYAAASQRLDVVDLAWTRWALDLSQVYRQSVCRAGERPERASRWLRAGWQDLLSIPDQRARDEASRLALDFPEWAEDLDDQELELLTGALVRFSVNGDEALRWIHFMSHIPPGERMLALLRVVEASERPFFRTLRYTLAQLWRNDPDVRAFCEGLPVSERPTLCPGSGHSP